MDTSWDDLTITQACLLELPLHAWTVQSEAKVNNSSTCFCRDGARVSLRAWIKGGPVIGISMVPPFSFWMLNSTLVFLVWHISFSCFYKSRISLWYLFSSSPSSNTSLTFRVSFIPVAFLANKSILSWAVV